MATDVYLQLDGIKGESTDAGHKDWIEVSRVTWSVYQPGASTASTSGGLTTGRAELSDLSFKKLADMASPILQQHCAMGKTIAKASFQFMRADGDGKPVNYYTVDLENVIVSSVTPDSGDSGIVTEYVHLAYSKMKWKYTRQGIKGGPEGNSAGGWDCASNRCA
ncbi:type VI secretion system tube protein Hcp [Massilia sp. CCM 8733]|uniref:Type VI secretion system tube protein Hcp n=1 Tax=Massilia mucilaginosa TaxID=2609282 RepID=A0ABX0NSY2_9BURK|nr:type VI secretion system tube protein Hcp [Massilia mucilaginosa]NHZ89855.1 type VI secretion system tube protein Hcp [Massilia mucilaginosa]